MRTSLASSSITRFLVGRDDLHLDPVESQAPTHTIADRVGVLADPTGEHESRPALEARGGRSDGPGCTGDEHLDRQPGVVVACGEQIAHVTPTVGDPHDPRTPVQLVAQVVGRPAVLFDQVEHHLGVDVSGAGRGDHPAARRERHRGVPRATVRSDRRDAAAAAEVRDDHAASLQQVGTRLDHRPHRESVEAVAADPEPGEGLGNREAPRRLGEPGVERGVEADHVGGVRPAPPGQVDGVELHRDVQGSQRGHPTQVRQQVVVDQARLVVPRAPVHDPVGDRPRGSVLLEPLGDRVHRRLPAVVNRSARLRVVGPGEGVRRTQPLDVDDVVRVRPRPIADARLERRRPGVQREDPHPGQDQSRISGRSSRCSRTYAACRSSCSWQWAASSAPPCGMRRARRSASRTRW